jgi:LysM repeat protein
MNLWPVRFTSAALLCASLSGCFPSARSQLEEEKEPHFLVGKSRANAMDHGGAIEAFEKALEVNPQSASAHFELGLLNEKNEQDYAAAIYHFQHFLKLRPNSDFAEIVRQRIGACKVELAKGVLPLPTTPSMQRDLEQLVAANTRLQAEVESLRAQLANRSPTTANAGTLVRVMSRAALDSGTVQPAIYQPSTAASAAQNPPASIAPGNSRTHTVQSGESPYSIARKYGVRLDSLMAANPRLDARKLRVGQALIVPVR